MSPDSFTGQITLGLLVNLVSSLLFAALPALLVAIAIRRMWLRDRYAFFGIRTHNDRVEIRLSNINVKRAGTTGVLELNVGFTGSAISEGEHQGAQALASTIEGGSLVGLGRLIADAIRSDVEAPKGICHISVSPYVPPPPRPSFDEFGQPDSTLDLTPRAAGLTESELSAATTWVFIGGPVYNSLTDYMFRTPIEHQGFFTLYRKQLSNGDIERGFVLKRTAARDPVYFLPRTYTRMIVSAPQMPASHAHETIYREYFVLQKVAQWSHRELPTPRTVFVCAGTSMSATVAGIRTLSDWRALHKDFGHESFAAIYEVETNDREWVTFPSAARVAHVSRVWSTATQRDA